MHGLMREGRNAVFLSSTLPEPLACDEGPDPAPLGLRVGRVNFAGPTGSMRDRRRGKLIRTKRTHRFPCRPIMQASSPPAFDAFLSYRANDADEAYVRQLFTVLRQKGLGVWYDRDQLQPGLSWIQLLEIGIAQSRSGLVLVGRDGLGSWQSEEVNFLLRRAVSSKIPVIPVLLPQGAKDVVLPTFLASRTWIDLRRGYTSELVAELLWGITGRKHAPAPLPEAASPSDLRQYIARRGHCIHKMKAKDATGRWAYYFVLVEPDMEVAFLDAIRGDGKIDLEHYGRVVASCYGESPTDEIRRYLKDTFGFSV